MVSSKWLDRAIQYSTLDHPVDQWVIRNQLSTAATSNPTSSYSRPNDYVGDRERENISTTVPSDDQVNYKLRWSEEDARLSIEYEEEEYHGYSDKPW